MSAIWNLIPAPLRAYAALALLILVVSGVSAVYLQGRQHGWDAHVVVAENEKRAQEAANREAIRLAGEDYIQTVDQILLDKERLSHELDRLSLEAAADPDADLCGIGAASSMRLNSIR